MSVYIRFLHREGGLSVGTDPPVGAFLSAYDPDAYDGRGEVEWTTDPAEAREFPDKMTAFYLWRAQSRIRPLRADGKPNRPLTAISVEITAEVGELRGITPDG